MPCLPRRYRQLGHPGLLASRSRSDTADEWVKIEIPPDLNPTQRAPLPVRCVRALQKGAVGGNVHHLPARYGRFGEPVLLGFVGLTESGKSHLLTSMVGRITGLSDYQIAVEPLDPECTSAFIENSVEAADQPQRGAPWHAGPSPRRSRTRSSCGTATGRNGWSRCSTCPAVTWQRLAGPGVPLDRRRAVLRHRPRPHQAHQGRRRDLQQRTQHRAGQGEARAEVARRSSSTKPTRRVSRNPWRAGCARGGKVGPAEFLRESADVYSYLSRAERAGAGRAVRGGRCEKATLHVASSTGGAKESENGKASTRAGSHRCACFARWSRCWR